jgi:hypothetical protein
MGDTKDLTAFLIDSLIHISPLSYLHFVELIEIDDQHEITIASRLVFNILKL